MFRLIVYFTRCRLSEALNVKVKDIDFSAGVVTIGTLKQQRSGVYRQVPLANAVGKEERKLAAKLWE